ncbi:protein FAM98A-like [Neocloeon triangulifer]|uniref:protein FAM98A-like n=1 Tax=Neocloeon triangulifer TaxID=2078957 RepID=UPI00286EBAA3|nr:protein FAM98A-like [Neocloeon triangulifer]
MQLKLFVVVVLVVLATSAWAQDEVQLDDDDEASDFDGVRVARSPYRVNNYGGRGNNRYNYGQGGRNPYQHSGHNNHRGNQYGGHGQNHGRYPNNYYG